MKSKKGFTLIELLVAIVVLGIIFGLSLSLLRNIQEKTRIEFIVKEGKTETHTEYEYRPVLVCGFAEEKEEKTTETVEEIEIKDVFIDADE